jgi:hypothetical protein
MGLVVFSAYYGAKHEDSVFGVVGLITFDCLAFPLAVIYGADSKFPVAALVALAFVEISVIAFLTYVVLLMRVRRDSIRGVTGRE